MRIAFVLQTHKCMRQIERLIHALQSTSSNHVIVVSHDGPQSEIERLSGLDGVTKAKAAVGGRGTFGLVEDFLASMRWLSSNKIDYDWLVMMSGQDYLTRPLADLERKLASSEFDGYYHHFRANDAAEATSGAMRWALQESHDRYRYRYRMLKPDVSRWEQILLKLPKDLINLSKNYRLSTSYGLMFGSRTARTPFDNEFELIGGSFWMTFRRSCAEFLIDYIAKHPHIEDHYRHTLNPDESFLHSILFNSKKFNISNDELRFYDFSGTKHGRPKIIDESDIPRLIRSGYYIARKFDVEKHPDILDRVDEAIARSIGNSHGRALERRATSC